MEKQRFDPNQVSDWFWNLIESAHGDRRQMQRILSELSEDDLRRYYSEFRDAALQLVDSPFIEHVAKVEEDVSEDTMRDIGDWVVSHGKEFYSNVWMHPEQIPTSVPRKSNRNFGGLAGSVFAERFGRSMAADAE